MLKLNIFVFALIVSINSIAGSKIDKSASPTFKSLKAFTHEFSTIQKPWLNNHFDIYKTKAFKISKTNSESEYAMTFNPVIGTFKGVSNLGEGINPNLTLKSSKLVYGIDWVSGRWVDEIIPTLQVPMRIRYLNGNEKTLKTSDGTYFPIHKVNDKDFVPFSYFSFSVDLYISPWPIDLGNFKIVPKFGVNMDLTRHSYEIDLTKYLGKEGTDANLASNISNLGASYDEPFYDIEFYSDMYGVNIGSYFLIGERFMIDAGYEYFPGRLITKALGDVVEYIDPYHLEHIKATKVNLSRFRLEGRLWLSSPISLFIRYDYSNFYRQMPGTISDMGITLQNRNDFFQRQSEFLIGISIGYFSE